VLPGVSPSNVYPTADDAEVVIAGNADSVFARLSRAMDQPELSTDERYATHGARGANMAELDERIAAWTATMPAAALLERLEAHGVPAGQIFTAREMLADPQYQARQMVQRHLSYQGWEVPMTGIVPRFTRTPGAVRYTGQPLGHDTEAVLRDLAGCTPDELDELAKAGLI
jgi:crotonobetainyl-CoA:carnitine CoA-transferase CaiB-like acyl-CoA transferase